MTISVRASVMPIPVSTTRLPQGSPIAFRAEADEERCHRVEVGDRDPDVVEATDKGHRIPFEASQWRARARLA
ncbi:hypothetical protein [Streptomyces tauricus]|uniref:hypothetical protein n=1 Tax=Streptomyces tauricus TaxID=68274 RepID=UPI0033A41BD9